MARSTLLLLVAAALPARAQSAARVPDSVMVTPGLHFSTGGLHRFFFGDHYRDLWLTPVLAEVLDLDRFEGGLTPLRRGGGLQTRSLRFQAGNGRQYVFRDLAKTPEAVVPQDLRGTLVEGVVRDQMSAIHPGGALAIPPLLEAVGVLHAPPLLRVMPDDPRLGEFRADFAGRLGTIEERPADLDDDTPAFAGARDIDGTPAFLESIWERPWIQVDARAFLTARLVDVFLGDWDRHEDQWRWALLGEGDTARWYPIPRDRDQAFARYDGFLLSITRSYAPQLLNFGDQYAGPQAATWNGRHLDRRLLAGLDWPVWDSISTSVASRITDSVIDQALSRLPPEYLAHEDGAMRRSLIIRRDGIPAMARTWYEFLTKHVNLHGSNRDDRAEITRLGSGRVRVVLKRARSEETWLDRTFDTRETDEIRIYLRGGDDRAEVLGDGSGPLIRLIGGPGRDTLIDLSEQAHVRYYDRGDETVGLGHRVDHTRFETPWEDDPLLLPDQDWGARYRVMPRVAVTSDVGLALGVSSNRKSYGFWRQPYANKWNVSLDWSFMRRSGRAAAEGRWRAIGRDTYATVNLMASGLEGLRFHGFGNGTAADQPKRFYLVRQQAFEIRPGHWVGLEGPIRGGLYLSARHTVTDPDNPDNAAGLIGQLRPLGLDHFGQFGGGFAFEVDTRDRPMGATKGVHARFETEVFPVTWGDREWATERKAFGSVEGSVATFLTPGGGNRLTLALRAGARRAWGEFPYFEASYLGGSDNLRGYPRNRFAGKGMAYGSAELRLKLFNAFVVVPGEFGIVGLADAGRVFSQEDTTERWYRNFGGGIFYSFVDRSFGAVGGLAKGDEGMRVYVGLGLGY